MNGISITTWVIFLANIVTPVSVAATSRFQSRSEAKPTHRAAFRWSRFDLIGVCGAALICLFLLQDRWLVLAECVVYVCCLASLGLNTWHAVKAAEAVTLSNATGRSCKR